MNLIDQQTPIPTSIPFPIELISITDQGMQANTYYTPNPTYTATLKNSGSDPAFDVYMKFKSFTYNSVVDCNSEDAKDTQLVKVSTYLMPDEPSKIKAVVPTNFDTSGQFNYCASIYSASLNPTASN